MRFVYGIIVGVVTLLPAGLLAQQKNAQPPEVDLAITYGAQRGNLTNLRWKLLGTGRQCGTDSNLLPRVGLGG